MKRCSAIRNIDMSMWTTSTPPVVLLISCSEQQHAIDRYEQWQKLQEKARTNVGAPLPSSYQEVHRDPPPPPTTGDDSDIMELSMVLNAVSIDGEVPGDLDESGMERVPMADPGMDVREPC